jgi:hypothetical protein
MSIHRYSRTYQNAAFKNLPRAVNAEYNFGPTGLRRRCTLHTREQMLSNLMKWATDNTQPPVYWLTGMAGTGKTTIAYSFCEILAERGMLGASFFCSRTVEQTRDPKIILPTISHQLSARSKAFTAALLNVIQEDDNIGNRSLQHQFDKLVLHPMTVSSTGSRYDLLVCDGFDEANKQDEISNLVSLFLKYSAHLPVKIFISSRYDRDIKYSFDADGPSMHTSFLLHNIEDHIVEADIRKYLLERLDQISERLRKPRVHWISDKQINQLITHAGRLFVYASAVCSYLISDDIEEVDTRLKSILAESSKPIPGSSKRPYEALDKLYSNVLATAAHKFTMGDMVTLLSVILVARHPLDITSISLLLDFKSYRVKNLVKSLHSVLTAPNNFSDSKPITIFHASFRDFLIEEERSGKFWIDAKLGHQCLAKACFRIMKAELCFNKCNIVSSFDLNANLSLEQLNHISATLFYSCCFWSDHTKEIATADEIQMGISYLICKQLLFWLEILSIKQALDFAFSALKNIVHEKVRHWLS